MDFSISLWSGALLCIVNFFLFMCGLVVNLVAIICIYRSSQRPKKLFHFTIFLLSFFDMAAVSVTHTLIVVSTLVRLIWQNNVDVEVVRINTNMILHGFSMLSLLTLNIERFPALVYPFFQETQVNKCRLLAFTAFQNIVLLISILVYSNMIKH